MLQFSDYYFAENFYLGLELGLGFRSNTTKEAISTITTGGQQLQKTKLLMEKLLSLITMQLELSVQDGDSNNCLE